MDFVKAMILYLSLTYAVGIGTALPMDESQRPAPTAAVTEAQTSGDPLVIGTLVSTPPPPTKEPVPTITPNRAYKTLRLNSKGPEVRQLQERLKELGYLSGNIDGVYGAQTKNAVRAFQKANGLSADGDAGPYTLTVLYESPNVMPNPAVMTPTPEPTATPNADGLVPMPETAVSGWNLVHTPTVLLDGVPLTLVTEDGRTRAPSLWDRGGGEIVVALDELAAAAVWGWVADAGENLSLQALGYDLDAQMMPSAQAEKAGTRQYCDAYALTDSGESVALSQGDLMSEDGRWYASLDFLRTAMNAEVTWDAEENTLLLNIPIKRVGSSTD